MHYFNDDNTKIVHIRTASDIALCGLPRGYTTTGEEPVKEKYGSTCASCQYEVSQIKKLKAK